MNKECGAEDGLFSSLYGTMDTFFFSLTGREEAVCVDCVFNVCDYNRDDDDDNDGGKVIDVLTL